MDIRQWLEDTADREPPDHSDDNRIPGNFRPDRAGPDKAGRSYRRKRKRGSSDSSIIAPRHEGHRGSQLQTRSSSPDHVRHAEDAERGSHEDGSSQDSRSAPGSAPRRTYEKRARHKTRADLYEPKAKKDRKRRDKRKEKKSQLKRRKSHRSGDGGRTAGLVQSFQLKNGPKNNRLTLKPDASAGMFKHGRAAVQVAGRGGGLPDLAFNEMKFLWKPAAHQDEIAGVEESKQMKSKNQKNHSGEEISAYFNAKKPAVVDEAESQHYQQEQSKRDSEHPLRSKQSKDAERTKVLVEFPEKRFLGFGSKGVQPVSNSVEDESTSCYTWSESVRRRSSARRNPALPEHDIRGISSKALRPKAGEHPDRRKGDNGRPNDQTVADAKHGTWIQTRRTRGPALVDVYQPPDPVKSTRRGGTPVIKWTSQSLPMQPSSPPVLHQNVKRYAKVEDPERDEYRTSDILKIQYAPMDQVLSFPPQQHSAEAIHEKENINPVSSLSIDKAIRRARDAAERPQYSSLPPLRPVKPVTETMPHIRRRWPMENVVGSPQLQHSVQVRTVHPLIVQNSPMPGAFTPRHGSLSHHLLSKTERRHWDNVAAEVMNTRVQSPHGNQKPTNLDDDDEMLDDAFELETLEALEDGGYAGDRHEHEHDKFHDRDTMSRSGIFAAQFSSHSHAPSHGLSAAQDMVSGSGQIRGFLMNRELYKDDPDVQEESAVDEGLAGFWKPNRLY